MGARITSYAIDGGTIYVANAGHILSLDFLVKRADGSVEDHGTVAYHHPLEEFQRLWLLGRLHAWHVAPTARLGRLILAHAHSLDDPDDLWQLLKGEWHQYFRPKIITPPPGGSPPVAGVKLPPLVGGGGPVFAYAGKLVTSNLLHVQTQTEPLNAGMGLGNGSASHQNYDAALFNPSPEARVAGTASQVATASGFATSPTVYDTEKNIATITATGTRAIAEWGLFDVNTAAPQTTLAAAISSATATSPSLAATLGGTPPFDIEVSDGTHAQETMIVTATGTNPTVTRGARGSTAQAALNSGANVVGGLASNGGGKAYLLADFAVINLSSGDSLQGTASVQYT